MQSDSCHFSQTFLIRTDTRGTVPSIQRYRGYRVFQKFVPIENCILCITSDASVGKFKLIQLRNLPGKQFKAISNKNLKKLFLKFCAKCARVRAFSRQIFPTHL